MESRAGINISPADLVALDELVTPLILQGQSPYMILRNHPEIALSEKVPKERSIESKMAFT